MKKYKNILAFSIYTVGDFMSNKKSLARFLIIGMGGGALLGTIIATLAATIWNNTFFAVSGTGFGIGAGMLLADIIWCLKNTRNKK